jgi:hypothetical protein
MSSGKDVHHPFQGRECHGAVLAKAPTADLEAH